jgi:large subunit ribosomal protein L3
VPPARSLQEIEVDKTSDYQVGQKLGVGVFTLGDMVHVTGITRGRGFAGGVRRWGWHGGPASHGSMTHRRIGSLGSGTTPGRPLKGRTQAGHYGVEQVTIRNLPIVKLEPEKGVLFVGGAIPGHRGSMVLIRKKA